MLQHDFSDWHSTLPSFISEGETFGVGEGERECERAGAKLQPYSCEYRFGYSLPQGRLQQANYPASVTERGRQKHSEANHVFQQQLQLQFHPVIHVPQILLTPVPLSLYHCPASTLIPQNTRLGVQRQKEEGRKGLKSAAK